MKANGRIWIETEEGPFVGAGRIELLQKIRALGSIRQAALEMKMSYRQAWQMVESMNRKAGTPLVISQRGGKGGGKATLTEKGERIVQSFYSLKEKFQQFLLEQSQIFNSEINE
jgi:molybdate transport system regulatory protein